MHWWSGWVQKEEDKFTKAQNEEDDNFGYFVTIIIFVTNYRQFASLKTAGEIVCPPPAISLTLNVHLTSVNLFYIDG
jgi:hypothetical protein